METNQATGQLARIWVLGGFGDAEIAIERVKAHSRRWQWDEANRAMGEAYAALNAEAPAVAVNAIHCGEHPVQIAADAFTAEA